MLLSQLTPHFSFNSCSFKVLRSKETTGRVVVARQMGLLNSFTLEASFCGPDGPTGEGGVETHYSNTDLINLGESFVQALHRFANPLREGYNSALSDLEALLPSGAKDGEASDEDAEPPEEAPPQRRSAVSTTASRRKSGAASGTGQAASAPGTKVKYDLKPKRKHTAAGKK
mmetsp:Transcript_44144/g.102030  ORF Transcript_44144/g.102030 Transcript_44144/m.102030 type:complete len:172 (+) Transcript_44144:86-601(+)